MNKDLSPYDLPELYDQIFEGFDFDIPFWRATALAAGGPVLDLGCGTGRVLMPLLEAGVDADGVDLYEPMLERARVKAAAGGFHPLLKAADMADFSMPRRYARIICAFNAFAHADTVEAQLATLRASLAHLEPGGGLVIHMSYPGPAYWAEPDGKPVMELETTRASDGHRFQMWDTRTKDIVRQCQSSEIEIRELDAAGAALVSHRVHTTQRWVYRFELELLFRLAGFARSEFFGGFDREPLERSDQQIIAWAWKACYNSSAERGTEQRRPG